MDTKFLLKLIAILTSMIGLILTIFGSYLAGVADANSSAIGLAVLGSVMIVLSLLGYCGASSEKSWMLLCYFYSNVFMIACLILFSIAAIFFQQSFESYIKHHWDDGTLEYLRGQTCCQTYEATVEYLEFRFVIVGSIGFVSIIMLMIATYCSVVIVSLPIIMKNMLAVINIIFMLVGSGIVLFGVLMKYHEEMEAGNTWMAYMFTTIGTIIFALALIGIIGFRAKSRLLLLVYAIGVFFCVLTLVICGILAFVFNEPLAEKYESMENIGDIACTANLHGCTNCTKTGLVPCTGVYLYTNVSTNSSIWAPCDDSLDAKDCILGKTVIYPEKDDQLFYQDIVVTDCRRCPEWSADDIEGYLEAGLQFLGLMSMLICVFLVVGLWGSLTLRKSLLNYQTDTI